MARELAKKIGYVYIDSGAMYRAVTLAALRNGLISADWKIDTHGLIALLPEISITFSTPDPVSGSSHTLLNGENVESEIRGMEVSEHVSAVSAIPEVRRRLTAMQQALGDSKGIVMDGRDIGTTVFPEAEMKVFVDASPEVRAKRRYAELKAKGDDISYAEVEANIRKRDETDINRKESPLRKAPDAHILNNDTLSRTEQMEWLTGLFHQITSGMQ